jgi:hypothetical protein
MKTPILRSITFVSALALLGACSDVTPVGPSETVAPALAKGNSAVITSLSISLTAPANAAFRRAKGKAKYVAKTGERELQIEVENVPAGTALVFSVGATQIGTATATSFGNGRLNLNSRTGATVPVIAVGMTISVTTAANAPVVSGTF